MVILTVAGPIEPESVKRIYLFETLPIDRTDSASSTALTERISLKNRHAVVMDPLEYIDNLKVSIDDVAQELADSESTVYVRMSSVIDNATHQGFNKSNHFLATATISEHMVRSSDDKQVEWLKCAIQFGINGAFCGCLVTTDLQSIKIYLQAHKDTGAPLIIDASQHGIDWDDVILSLNDCHQDKLVFLNIADQQGLDFILKKTICWIGFTCSTPEASIITESRYIGYRIDQLARIIENLPVDRLLISPGLRFKTHLRNYGGFGIGYLYDWVTKRFGGEKSEMLFLTNPAKFLSFPWSPTKVEVIVKKDIWTCHVCNVTEDEDVQNYTKMGFVYCSMTCLSKHRKLGFK